MSAPTSFRLTPAGVAALKVLENKFPERTRTDLISQILVDAAAGNHTVVANFNTLSAADILLYRGAVAEAAAELRKLRSVLIKYGRGGGKEATNAVINAAKDLKVHFEKLAMLDERLEKAALLSLGLASLDDLNQIEFLRAIVPKWVRNEKISENTRRALTVLDRILNGGRSRADDQDCK